MANVNTLRFVSYLFLLEAVFCLLEVSCQRNSAPAASDFVWQTYPLPVDDHNLSDYHQLRIQTRNPNGITLYAASQNDSSFAVRRFSFDEEVVAVPLKFHGMDDSDFMTRSECEAWAINGMAVSSALKRVFVACHRKLLAVPFEVTESGDRRVSGSQVQVLYVAPPSSESDESTSIGSLAFDPLDRTLVASVGRSFRWFRFEAADSEMLRFSHSQLDTPTCTQGDTFAAGNGNGVVLRGGLLLASCSEGLVAHVTGISTKVLPDCHHALVSLADESGSAAENGPANAADFIVTSDPNTITAYALCRPGFHFYSITLSPSTRTISVSAPVFMALPRIHLDYTWITAIAVHRSTAGQLSMYIATEGGVSLGRLTLTHTRLYQDGISTDIVAWYPEHMYSGKLVLNDIRIHRGIVYALSQTELITLAPRSMSLAAVMAERSEQRGGDTHSVNVIIVVIATVGIFAALSLLCMMFISYRKVLQRQIQTHSALTAPPMLPTPSCPHAASACQTVAANTAGPLAGATATVTVTGPLVGTAHHALPSHLIDEGCANSANSSVPVTSDYVALA